jgi:hypothetical protein
MLVAVMLVAGCAGTSGPSDADGDTGSAQGAGGNGTSGAPVPDDLNRTLASAPDWRVGEWWRVEVTDVFSNQPRQVTRVVAGVEGDHYLIGMPRDSFSHEVMVLHVPGFGHVDQLDHGFEIHDVLFIPIQFPLEEGRTWDTAFEGRPMTAEITQVSADEATVRMERYDNNDQLVEWIDAAYDVALGEYRSMTISGYATVEVLDHGFGYEGVVTVPHEHDVVFIHGRVAGAVSAGGGEGPVGGPTETIVVDSTYQRVSFIILLGDLDPSLPGLGAYSLKATAPDGTVYEDAKAPGDGPGYQISYYGHDSPGGSWDVEYTAAGPGLAFIEGIAYHVFDISLPDGCLMAHGGEHAHGDAGCGSDGSAAEDEHAGH